MPDALASGNGAVAGLGPPPAGRARPDDAHGGATPGSPERAPTTLGEGRGAPTPRRGRLVSRPARQLGGIVLAILLWEAFAASHVVSPDYLPSPIDVAKSANGNMLDLLRAAGSTLEVAAGGLVLAIVVGVPLGQLVGRLPRLSAGVEWIVRGTRAVPSLALIPLAILFLGLTTRMVVILVAFAAFWPMFVNSRYGAQRVSARHLEVARSLNFPARRTFLRVVLPSSAPLIASGVRTSIGLALVSSISAELVTGNGGIGEYILIAQQNLLIDLVYLSIVVGGALGWLVTVLFNVMEGRLLRWNYRASGGGQ